MDILWWILLKLNEMVEKEEEIDEEIKEAIGSSDLLERVFEQNLMTAH
jgi:hypothetical protein